MICTAVPREAIDIVWPDVINMLNKAVETSKGKYHINDIYEDLTKGFYALDDGKLTSVLVRAVQELSAKVTELEKKLGE